MKRVIQSISLIMLVLVFIAAPIFTITSGLVAASGLGTPTTTVNGWLTDLDGNLVKDNQGYYVLTLTPAFISSGNLMANLDPFTALFLNDFHNVSSARSTKKLKIVNATGKKLTFLDYEFSTENVLPRSDNLFQVTTGTLSSSMGRVFGSAYTAMLSSITSPRYRTDLCLDVEGFDGKNINLLIAPMRCVNDAVMAFYGVDASYDITLPQLMNLDENLKKAGYTDYADYLRKYYQVSSLYVLPLDTAYNILGTTRGSQSAVTNWRDNTVGGKPIPASEVGKLTNAFKIWGILGQNNDPSDRAKYPYVPNYFMMETDPEVIQFAYDYLYSNGLRFSFDMVRQPFDTTDSEFGRGGPFGIKSYVNKTTASNTLIEEIFKDLVLKNGDSLTLDNVSAGLYVPNAWNQHRFYDFGVRLVFSVSLDNWIPKTGEAGSLGILVGFGLILLAFMLNFLRRRARTNNQAFSQIRSASKKKSELQSPIKKR